MKTDDRLYDFLFLFHRFISFPTHLRVTIPIKLHRSRFIMEYNIYICNSPFLGKECLCDESSSIRQLQRSTIILNMLGYSIY